MVARLRARYGPQPAPAITDPFQQVLHEQVAYLASDEKRQAAFELLASTVGLEPADILAATDRELRAATSAGGPIAADERAGRMRQSARMVGDRWRGSLADVLVLPADQAAKVLEGFPMIGRPGADRILMIAGASNRLALDSNGLRVLQRLGYGREDRNYGRAYRSVADAIDDQRPATSQAAVEAHGLLRAHGKTLCRRSSPDCGACPLSADCAWAQARRA